jgi:hypothetical protein
MLLNWLRIKQILKERIEKINSSAMIEFVAIFNFDSAF